MASKVKELKEERAGGITRRKFIKTAATGAALATSGGLIFPRYGAAKPKTLKILQWVHFVPGYDKWFNETYIKEWGQKNDTQVIVDNIGLAGLNSRAPPKSRPKKVTICSCICWPKPDMEEQVIDHREIYEECINNRRRTDRPVQFKQHL